MRIFITILLIFNSFFFVQSQTTQIYCDFESPCQIITIDSTVTTNIWQIGFADKPNFIFPNNSISTDTILPYPPNNYSVYYVKIPRALSDHWIDVWFYHIVDTEEGQDGGYIEISTDDGQTWENVINCPYYDWDQNMYTDTNLLYNGEPGFSGQKQAIWPTMFSIWMFEIDTLNLRFVFISDSIDSAQSGWSLDEFEFLGGWWGISETQQSIYNIYPNPISSNAVLSFENPESKTFSLDIYSNSGQFISCIDGINGNELRISRESLIPGVYYFRLHDSGSTHCSGRFVVE
jgi:hypothetical protein